jgi:hypothetical protein
VRENKSIVSEKLKKYFLRCVGIEVTESTILFKELEMNGDDAYFFMLDFGKEFQIDLDGFELSDYFPAYDRTPFHYWVIKFFKPKKLDRKVFRINHLIKVVEKGKWFDP